MTDLTMRVTWVDVRDGVPPDGIPVAAAITGRYRAEGAGPGDRSGEVFWLVMPMHFASLHFGEDETEHRNCFVDSDGVVRLPHGLASGPASDETVTHWALLPTLPGQRTRSLLGEDVQPALQRAWDART
jgi:hypothetical protein